MKYEKFEQEYMEEINQIKILSFQPVEVPEFKVPAYTFVYKKALSIAFAIPALAMAFAFFFYTGDTGNPYSKDLAQIEASNNRIIDEINTLDHESNL